VSEPARNNEDELLVTAVVGDVTSPTMGPTPYEVGADGLPAVPVGVGGISYNVRVGMNALGWAGDQVEPGVSIANADAAANEALNVFACVGNGVVVRSGEAAGAHGRGMRVEGLTQVACHSLGPKLWSAWAPMVRDGRLALRVTRVLPPEVVGMGSGRVSAVTSIALQRDGAGDSLEGLRLGDLVAIRDWDATYYTGYREGALTVGVVVCGDSPVLGNGPGVTLLVSAADDALVPDVDSRANIAELLSLG
jgi:hypothetical protein